MPDLAHMEHAQAGLWQAADRLAGLGADHDVQAAVARQPKPAAPAPQKSPATDDPALIGDIELAVLDTNVLLDWLVFQDARLDPLRQALLAGRLRWITCERMLDEFAHVLGREPLSARPVDRHRVDQQIARHAWPVEHRHEPVPPGWPRRTPRCSDPDDQIFIDLAIAQGARWLLTRDRALLRLARKLAPLGVCVATPEAWAERCAHTRAAST